MVGGVLQNQVLGGPPALLLHHHHHLHHHHTLPLHKLHLSGHGCLKASPCAVALASPAPQRFFVTCAPGLEALVAAELSSPSISASNILIGSSGVSFSGSLQTALNANLWLRCAIRVLIELASSPLPPRRHGPFDPVYSFVREAVDWPTILVENDSFATELDEQVDVSSEKNNAGTNRSSDGARRNSGGRPGKFRRWRFRTFAIQCRLHDCQQVNNSMFASVRAKDAICDSIRDFCRGSKPDPPEDGATPDVPLFLYLHKDHACLYRDMSGMSLHRRGYRDVMHRASLNEAIAAGILTIAGWNSRISGFGAPDRALNTLLDPMCGSGTLLIEAALMACNRAPGLMRSKWPFQTWHDFDEALWKKCWNKASTAETSPPEGLRLLGNDIHEGALSLCIKDAKSAGVHSLLDLCCKDCQEYIPPAQPSLVVVNPPWGTRLGLISNEESEDVIPIWQGLGQFLKRRCNCADVYVLSGNSLATRGLRMKTDKKWTVTVGGVECKVLHYYVLPPKSSSDPKFL